MKTEQTVFRRIGLILLIAPFVVFSYANRLGIDVLMGFSIFCQAIGILFIVRSFLYSKRKIQNQKPGIFVSKAKKNKAIEVNDLTENIILYKTEGGGCMCGIWNTSTKYVAQSRVVEYYSFHDDGYNQHVITESLEIPEWIKTRHELQEYVKKEKPTWL